MVIGSHELGGPKPRQVLEILLLKLGTPVSKNHLIDVLWNGQPPAEALSTLESYVSVLRRHLQPGSGKGGALRTVTGGYLIDRAAVDLDLDRFDDLLKQAGHAAPAESYKMLEKALEIASVPLLGDELLAGWAEEERALHAARVASIKARAAEAAVTVGQPERAVALASELLLDDPINERAWTCMVLGLEESGQYMEALRAYGRCRRCHGPGDRLPARAGSARCARPAAPGNRRRATTKLLTCPTGDSPLPPLSSQRMREISILTIDDHSTFTELLTAALDREPDLRSVASATTAKSGVEQSMALKPDVGNHGLPPARRRRPHRRCPHPGGCSTDADRDADRLPDPQVCCDSRLDGHLRLPSQGRLAVHAPGYAPVRTGRQHGCSPVAGRTAGHEHSEARRGCPRSGAGRSGADAARAGRAQADGRRSRFKGSGASWTSRSTPAGADAKAIFAKLVLILSSNRLWKLHGAACSSSRPMARPSLRRPVLFRPLESPASERSEVFKAVRLFPLMGLVALVVVITPVAFWIWSEAERHALQNSEHATQQLAQNVAGLLLDESVLSGRPSRGGAPRCAASSLDG